ncbi:MerR family transcriptional regulator [Erythrobacter sp. SCSIO 43205]|uniref:MerR family transcriptional regulator n=1 Tax=Erythrobacter sp. SCSIO 43205 TaxID=2779361 RepID=UPI001CA8D6AC|nr:MerR family transcriptional regulator [Erythrobacter sp. SCSIO 43205]UAB77693.1 MerR family transcriptional regulator [Erythrobacter sp. SCSIO 43205]
MAEFADGKAKSAFRTIGEVSEALDIKPHVLRYWEQQFSLLKPMKRSGGRRLYRPSDVEMVQEIDRLVNQEGYTLKGAEAYLRAHGAPGSERRRGDRRVGDRRVSSGDGASNSAQPTANSVAKTDGPDLSESIAKLKEIRNRLAKAIEA